MPLYEQEQAVRSVAHAFYLPGETDFGWTSLVCARFTKQARTDFEDSEIKHQFSPQQTRSDVVDAAGARMFSGLMLPLSRFHWKVAVGAQPIPQASRSVYWAGCSNQIKHPTFLSKPGVLVENRHAIASTPKEKRMMRMGRIPVLDLEEDSPLRSGGCMRSALLSLNRVETHDATRMAAQNLTLEFDPRTVELVSTRSYRAPLNLCVLNATAADHSQLSNSICEHYQ